jgi:hypothetical protein
MSYTNGLDKPTDYFNTNLWSADDSNPRSITTTHATDWVWIKSRNQAYIHRLFDSVRGATKRLRSNGTNAEDTASSEVTAFTSTGYTIDSGLNSTGPTTNWVGWSWKAGGTASSNTDGSITSTVSANTTSGFSIVQYTGNGSANQTVGHGLGAVPKMIIFKRTNSSSDWIVYHNKTGATKYLSLNGTGAASAYEPYFANTEPTSSVFTVDTAGDINGSGNTFVAYCFSEVKSFSKFGNYVGNGSSDGSYIHLGFKPAFVMVKDSTSSGQWFMRDNKRDTYNPAVKTLYANGGGAEEDAQPWDMLSNGFKMRNTDTDLNNSGETYIYMAFAENPFVTSTGIPTTAR